MKAVTLRTPWAWAVCHAAKDIENRVWKPTPNQLAVGERFAIHAGKLAPLPEIRDAFGWMIERGLVAPERLPDLGDLRRGESAIVAIATFGGAVKAHPSLACVALDPASLLGERPKRHNERTSNEPRAKKGRPRASSQPWKLGVEPGAPRR